MKDKRAGRILTEVLLAALALLALHWLQARNFLLFHGLAEVFSVVVACGIFMIAWNGRRFITNNYLLFIGIAYLFVAGLDLLHTFAYTGMGPFPGAGANLPTQLWLAGRYVEAGTLLAAPLMLRRRVNAGAVAALYTVLTALLIGSIFVWDAFPTAYLESAGRLTTFKVASEYAVCGVLLAAGLLLYSRRGEFAPSVLRMLMASIGATIAAELLFTLYRDPYGPANVLGHFGKIVSFYFIYKAVIETSLVEPYSVLFRNVKRNEARLQQARDKLEERVQRRTAALREANRRLEQQVEERKRAERRLRRANDLLESAFSNIHILISYLDSDLNILHVNQAFADAHGGETEDFIGRTCFELFDPAAHREVFQNVLQTGRPHFAFDEPLARPRVQDELSRRYWDWSLQPVQGEDDSVKGLVLCMIDVTSRRHAREALRESERRFRQLVENAHEVIFRWRTRPELAVEYVSPAAVSITGYGPEEFYADPELMFRMFEPEDRESFRQILQQPEAGSGPFVLHCRRKDGAEVWIELSAVPIRGEQGGQVAVEGIARDVTERRRNEKRILTYQKQLRSLASELMLAEERERRRIAADLHDGVGQYLAAARMKIGALSQSAAEPESEETLSEVRDLLDQTIQDTRTLTFEISPPVLYELGLPAALEWLAGEVGERYDICATFENRGAPPIEEEDVRVMLFRAVREVVHNATKHARADRVEVSMQSRNQGAIIRVEDDGAGFDTSILKAEDRPGRGFGLFNIRERLEHLGGRINIESAPGRGTEVTLFAPLESVAAPGEAADGDDGSAG